MKLSHQIHYIIDNMILYRNLHLIAFYSSHSVHSPLSYFLFATCDRLMTNSGEAYYYFLWKYVIDELNIISGSLTVSSSHKWEE